jgi:hypothetical protein
MKAFFWAILHSIAAAAVLVGLVYWNWSASRSKTRLVWTVRAKSPIYAGELIPKDRLEGGLSYLGPDGRGVETIRDVAGRYGTADFTQGVISHDKLRFHVPVAASEAGSVFVAVEVGSQHTSVLRPGMLLAFARQDEKKQVIYPSLQQIRSGKAPPLRLVAITPKEKDVTSLVIEVPPCALPMLPMLAIGQWRPILVRGLD